MYVACQPETNTARARSPWWRACASFFDRESSPGGGRVLPERWKTANKEG